MEHLPGTFRFGMLSAFFSVFSRPWRQTDFESKFEAERMSRLEREGRILKQLADHEQEVATDFETERVSPKIEKHRGYKGGKIHLIPMCERKRKVCRGLGSG